MSTSPELPFPSVTQWFEHQERLTPDAVALVFNESPITYRELNARANRLARVLQTLGVGPDRVAAFCLSRTPELVVALLAVMKAGGAYLPIDRDLPLERQAFMLKDAQPIVLLTEKAFCATLPQTGTPLFVLDEEQPRIAAESEENLEALHGAENLAYVMYTSGSTGTPKGVEIPHRALVNFLVAMQKRPGLSAEDVLVAITTVSFDISGLEIYLPLVTGARLVLLNRDDVGDGFRIMHHLEKEKATVLQATPSTWRMLLDAKWPGSPGLKMLCGGEGLPRDLANRLIEKGGELWNMYGPTETTIWSACSRVEAGTGIITIGEPVDATQLYILDAKMRQVPPGVPGELYIGGAGLARGYRNRPDLTAERFLPDPFLPGNTIYKTGDVARARGQQIEVQGRIDHQVKIRGYRIELGEIETRLAEFPAVKEAVVMAHELSPDRRQLVAYVITSGPAGDTSALGASLRDFLKRTLPDYMIPSFFEFLATFPLTPNGKIDRKALPLPKIEQARASSAFVAPQGPIETKLAEIWSEILGREKVGVRDNIFEIGGDSLLIFRIAARANEAGLAIAVRQFFQYRTIAELAAQIGTAPVGAVTARPSLVAVSRESYRRPAVAKP